MLKKQTSVTESQRISENSASVPLAQLADMGAPTVDRREYDFFISHASEDKAAVAEPLANALVERSARVWFDKYTLRVGDSLRRSIDEGLASSRFGIVILSKPYFTKYWTGKELDGLFARQENGVKVILPIWHEISKDAVKSFSPMLADTIALRTSDFTIDELADELISLIV